MSNIFQFVMRNKISEEDTQHVFLNVFTLSVLCVMVSCGAFLLCYSVAMVVQE